MIDLPTHTAKLYVQPLREGGSLPAVVDTDGGLFVVKFRGAGQGVKALIAELIVGLLARALGLPVPELALIEVIPLFGRAEPDPEIQDVLRSSHGINFGLRYLDGAFNFDALAAGSLIDPRLAAELVWFDAYVTNPDRTHRNPNLLIWERTVWLIDHGAALYAHHDWSTVDEARTRAPFSLVREHILLAPADDLEAADARLAPRLSGQLLDDVLAAVPDAWLMDPLSKDGFATAAGARARYREYLGARLREPRAFVRAAVQAQRDHAGQLVTRRSARR
jgi:hypothetical protein